MRKIGMILVLSFFALGFTGCVNLGHYQGFGPYGLLFNQYSVGVSGSGNVKASKEGRACVNKISVFLTSGDASIQEAAAAGGGIKRIASVQKEGFGILVPYVYQRLCTVVRGD